MPGLLDSKSLERTLLSFNDLGLRVDWLRAELAQSAAGTAARALNQLCERAEVASADAREALLAVALYVLAEPDAPLLHLLRRQAEAEHLLSLERLLRRGGAANGAVAERPPEEARVPDYGVGRELTLGERRSLARRAPRAHFERLLADPHPWVIAELLCNPRLTENDVIRLAARRPARVLALRELCRSSRWVSRARVRNALIFNPGCPPELSVPLLCLCTRGELLDLVRSPDTPVLLRATARELLERRPPWPQSGDDSPINWH